MTSLIASSTVQLDIQTFASKAELNKGRERAEEISKYTLKYRVIKTCLMIVAWIAFGANNEIIGSTYEDLRIMLNLNYNGISNALVIKGIGTLGTMFVSGMLYDRVAGYAELLMACSGFMLVMPNFFIPVIQNYWCTYLLFFIQGCACAVWDIGGNTITLRTWEGISTSPLNAMHAGYGIGGILAVQISKPFLKFDKTSISSNSTLPINPNDIEIATPYTISGSIGLFIMVFLFLVAQVIEHRNNNRYKTALVDGERMLKNKIQLSESQDLTQRNHGFLQGLFFGDKHYKGKALAYMTTQIALISIMFFFLAGYIAVITKFMLTYLTKGPANFTVDVYTQLQTVYWALFVCSRFSAAIFAFKLDPLVFLFGLFLANMIICFLFVVPYFTTFPTFYWYGMLLMGITSGPMQPSSYMIAKDILVEYNSFILSVFSIGVGFGALFFQEITGRLLDYFSEPRDNFLGFEVFQPAIVISHLFFVTSLLCFLLLIPIFYVYKKFVYLVKKDQDNEIKDKSCSVK